MPQPPVVAEEGRILGDADRRLAAAAVGIQHEGLGEALGIHIAAAEHRAAAVEGSIARADQLEEDTASWAGRQAVDFAEDIAVEGIVSYMVAGRNRELPVEALGGREGLLDLAGRQAVEEDTGRAVEVDIDPVDTGRAAEEDTGRVAGVDTGPVAEVGTDRAAEVDTEDTGQAAEEGTGRAAEEDTGRAAEVDTDPVDTDPVDTDPVDTARAAEEDTGRVAEEDTGPAAEADIGRVGEFLMDTEGLLCLVGRADTAPVAPAEYR